VQYKLNPQQDMRPDARGSGEEAQEEEVSEEEEQEQGEEEEEEESSDVDEVSWIQWFCSLQVCALSRALSAPPSLSRALSRSLSRSRSLSLALSLCAQGNEFFTEVAEDFVQDDFNLTGLGSQVLNVGCRVYGV
jgi:hypothetical protein